MCANICKACVRLSEKGGRNCFIKLKNGLRLYTTAPFPTFGLKKGLRSTFVMIHHMYSTKIEHVNPVNDAVLDEERSVETVDESSDALTVGPPEELMLSLSEEDQRRLKVLWMELEVFRQSGTPVPRKLTIPQWNESLGMGSRSQRLKFYRYLCVKESRQEHTREKKIAQQKVMERVRAERELEKETNPNANLEYGLSQNAILLRVRDSTMNSMYNIWQCHAIMYGQEIVIDLGYDEHMVHRESMNCADQIRNVYGCNKMNRQPFNLHLCNADPKSSTMQNLLKFIPNMYSSSCLMTVTEKSYLDLFPKSKLVYLTPHCKNELTHFDHDSVYIIGGIVDKTIQKPISLAKAKREGIRVARLPLDHYLDWGDGTKSLTLDQMIKIMLDIKNTGCWNTALEHVPKRKIKDSNVSYAPSISRRYRVRPNLFDDDED